MDQNIPFKMQDLPKLSGVSPRQINYAESVRFKAVTCYWGRVSKTWRFLEFAQAFFTVVASKKDARFWLDNQPEDGELAGSFYFKLFCSEVMDCYEKQQSEREAEQGPMVLPDLAPKSKYPSTCEACESPLIIDEDNETCIVCGAYYGGRRGNS